MSSAIAKTSFVRSDTKASVKKGQVIRGDENYLKDLHRVGLVSAPENKMMSAPENKADPITAGGAKLSASLAAQASRKQTAKKSKLGVKKNPGGAYL